MLRCVLPCLLRVAQLAEGREILMHHCHGSDAMYQFSLTLNLATAEGKERFIKKWALDRHKVIALLLILLVSVLHIHSYDFPNSAATCSTLNHAHCCCTHCISCCCSTAIYVTAVSAVSALCRNKAVRYSAMTAVSFVVHMSHAIHAQRENLTSLHKHCTLCVTHIGWLRVHRSSSASIPA
jgi:hypothetical protein